MLSWPLCSMMWLRSWRLRRSFNLEEGASGSDEDGEGYQVARRSLASIFGEAEVVEVDEAQADESLLVGLDLLDT